MVILTESDFDTSRVVGAFTNASNAQTYAETVMRFGNLSWSGSDADKEIWVYAAGGLLSIVPIEFLDSKLEINPTT